MGHTIDLHASEDTHERQEESREEQRLGRMRERPLQGSAIHEEASGNTNKEGYENQEIEDEDDGSNYIEARKSFRSSAQ